ncbi:MAG TPA: helix-turn-helix domain-containing protein [Dehalococcoidia bacterium]|nr:helix-turn-helix domain-containing protein [Dehalococcoidia bacterium]
MIGLAGAAPRRIVVIAFNGARFLDIVGPLEVFTVANEQGEHYLSQVATMDGKDVITTTGTRLGADVSVDALDGQDIDLLLVPGSPDWNLLLEPELVDAVKLLGSRARRVVSVFTGTFALAAAGLLNGKRAATHWRHAAALKRRFPQVDVDPEALFVRDGEVLTSAGIASGIDLALAIVEDDLGVDVARGTAKVLVVFLQRPGGQSQFSTWTMSPVVRNEPLRAILDDIALNPVGNHTVEAIAERSNFSVRHISRLFLTHLGATPSSYIERVRVETARVMLEASDEDLAEVASRSGFGSVESMRRAFVRNFGVPPATYRARFRTSGIANATKTDNAAKAPAKPHRVPVSPPA